MGGGIKHFSNLPSEAFIFISRPQSKNEFLSCVHEIKNPAIAGLKSVCGERGIRTPGGVTLNGFQDRRNRPLCHLSAAKVHKF